MKHEDVVGEYLRGQGIEIGAFQTPIPGISPIYIDKFEEFAGERSTSDYLGDAVALPVCSNSLDYVANSHLIEHISNPVKALLEWQRVLKNGACLYIVIPDRRYTFDRARPLTEAAHMIDDYLKEVDDTDSTHIEDFIYGIDWRVVSPDTDPETHDDLRKQHCDHYFERTGKGEEINIHFHVFEPCNFEELVVACREHPSVPFELELIRVEEQFPEPEKNGFLVVLRKDGSPQEGFLSKARSSFEKVRHPNYPMTREAVAIKNETES
jgi:SAM-dependent methyltransferase